MLRRRTSAAWYLQAPLQCMAPNALVSGNQSYACKVDFAPECERLREGKAKGNP